jgi:hypothetical protein
MVYTIKVQKEGFLGKTTNKRADYQWTITNGLW